MVRVVFLAFIGVVILIIFIPGFARMQELKARNRDLQTQISDIEEENIALKRDIERLKNDVVYIESVAREKMGVVREGEVVYHIVPGEKEE